ncbi:MAG: Pnap_2097 family protein [Pseudomonadota bacterium]
MHPHALKPGPEAGTATRTYTINMPQMALSGLGESWLSKEVGDIHWGMITGFLGKPSRDIVDAEGHRLYATFARLVLEITPDLTGFAENAPLEIASRLSRYGESYFFAHHDIASSGARGRAQTMSTFAKHGLRGQNNALVKGSPVIPDPDLVPSLDVFPEFGVEYRAARGVETKDAIFECTYEIQPVHDVNGVGLLYFAAYPAIFDLCTAQYEGRTFLTDHATVSKDVRFLGNADPQDTLVFRLHSRTEKGATVHHVGSLWRQTDGRRIAEIESVKRRL